MARKMTRKERDAIVRIVEDSSEYDAATVRISAEGSVTARKSADKVPGFGPDFRYYLGEATEILRNRELF